MNEDLKARLQYAGEQVNRTLTELLGQQDQIEPTLKKAIKYTLEAGGKRIRSALVLWSCELTSGKINHNAEIAAAAIEMVHTYSLVHDDLPSMDDDDMRRGRPTCHKVFGEAAAVLAGDGLLTLAFEVLAERIDNPLIAVKLIGELAQAAGPSGMIAGQMADLNAENSGGSRELLEYIHINKTAKMFRCATVMGGLCGGAGDSELKGLAEYGLKLGLGFQIADDILDVSASSEQLGKTAGKDAEAGKITYPSVVGLEESRQLEKKLAGEALAALELFGPRAVRLRELATGLLERTH